MIAINLNRRDIEVRTMKREAQLEIAVELAGRAVGRAREGKGLKALRSLCQLALVVLFASGCATTYRPTPTGPTAFDFVLTTEQCLALKKERRAYRATEQTAGYVAGAGALVSVIALGFVDADAVPVVASSVGLVAGGTLAFTGSQVESLDAELAAGGCGR